MKMKLKAYKKYYDYANPPIMVITLEIETLKNITVEDDYRIFHFKVDTIEEKEIFLKNMISSSLIWNYGKSNIEEGSISFNFEPDKNKSYDFEYL